MTTCSPTHSSRMEANSYLSLSLFSSSSGPLKLNGVCIRHPPAPFWSSGNLATLDPSISPKSQRHEDKAQSCSCCFRRASKTTAWPLETGLGASRFGVEEVGGPAKQRGKCSSSPCHARATSSCVSNLPRRGRASPQTPSFLFNCFPPSSTGHPRPNTPLHRPTSADTSNNSLNCMFAMSTSDGTLGCSP